MNLYNQEENELLANELIALTDQWPNCNQERAIELQVAFNEFSKNGGTHWPEVVEIQPRNELIYTIKRDIPRATRYMQSVNEINAEIDRRKGCF
jgi:hypothetical protein